MATTNAASKLLGFGLILLGFILALNGFRLFGDRRWLSSGLLLCVAGFCAAYGTDLALRVRKKL